jgi:hypothetical protein
VSRLLAVVDRGLLNPWVSRMGNASFLVGAVVFVVSLLRSLDPLTAVGVVLMAVGVLYWLVRWLRGRKRQRPRRVVRPSPEGIAETVASSEGTIRERAQKSGRTPGRQGALEGIAQNLQQIERDSERKFLDRLAELYEEGQDLRRRMNPPVYALAQSIAASGAGVHERQARAWTQRVRAELESGARRYVPIFDEGEDLPPPNPMAPSVPVVNKEALNVYVTNRLDNLTRIIRALHEER